MFKGFQQTLWEKISIATELKGGKYQKSVLDKYTRRYIYHGGRGVQTMRGYKEATEL